MVTNVRRPHWEQEVLVANAAVAQLKTSRLHKDSERSCQQLRTKRVMRPLIFKAHSQAQRLLPACRGDSNVSRFAGLSARLSPASFSFGFRRWLVLVFARPSLRKRLSCHGMWLGSSSSSGLTDSGNEQEAKRSSAESGLGRELLATPRWRPRKLYRSGSEP